MDLRAYLLTDSSDVDEIGFRRGLQVIVQRSCKQAYILSGWVSNKQREGQQDYDVWDRFCKGVVCL